MAILIKRQGPPGPEGPQGPVGPPGTTSVVSAFVALNGGIVNLTNTYSIIASTTITTTGTGHIVGQCNLQVRNTDNEDHVVDFYLIVNGGTSNVTTEDVRKINGGVPGYANLSIIYRCPIVTPATYPIQLWGRYSTGSAPTAGQLIVDHVDILGLGNLA